MLVGTRLFDDTATVERDGLTFAAEPLADALAGKRRPGSVRVLSAFHSREEVSCRSFLSSNVSGIACHEHGGWHLRVIRSGISLNDPAGVAATEQALREASAAIAAQ